MQKMMLGFILINLLIGHGVSAYNILIFHPTPSYSHQLPVMALVETLVNRGHQLFLISTNGVPGLEKNYTFIDMSFTYSIFHPEDENDSEGVNIQRKISKWGMIDIFDFYASVATKQFKSEPFQQFQKRIVDEKISFDVVIVEEFFIPHGCAMSRLLCGRNTPIITISTTNGVMYGEDDHGSILHLSYLPSGLSTYTNKMSLIEKVENWVSHHYIIRRFKNTMEETARAYFRETYGPEKEALVDGCWSNVSISLISSNSLYYYPRMLGPNVVELGPLHIKPVQKLPQIVQNWLDGADKGVIYFSLGSNMKSKSLPESVRNNFIKFFRELPPGYRVLWKWELEGKIPGQSDNILAQQWLAQQSVLAHPKVKVFITQGGLQSFQETVHFGVPTVGIPWFGDQELNVAKMVDAEIGVRILPQDLDTHDKVKFALDAVLFDERYTRNMKKLSAVSREFTAEAMNKAVFWVEHVAEHGGAPHLKPSTAHTTYFQFFCLDILAVILTVIAVLLFIVISIFRRLISVFSSSSSKIKKS